MPCGGGPTDLVIRMRSLRHKVGELAKDALSVVAGSGNAALPFIALVFFTLFEVLVAFLQAYVFTLLTGVYINAAISHEH